MTAVLENPTAIAAETVEATAFLTVYSKPACVQCNGTYRHLDKKGVAYDKVDMSQDPEALEQARALGHMQAPVGIVKDAEGQIIEHWAGYRPDMLDKYVPQLASAL